MELRKEWFPILLAVAWVAASTFTLVSVSRFASEAPPPPAVARQAPVKAEKPKQAAGRRPLGRAVLALEAHR